MSQEHDDARRLYDRLNQTRANNAGVLSKEEWLRIGAEQFKAARDEERVAAGLKPKRSRGVRDPLFDTLATATGMNLKEMTKAAAQGVGIALAGIRTATPDVTPEELILRVGAYRRKHPTYALTAKSIEKYWPTLGTGRATAQAAAQDPRVAAGAPKGWQDWMRRRRKLWEENNNGYSAPGEYPLEHGDFFGMPGSWQAECWETLAPK